MEQIKQDHPRQIVRLERRLQVINLLPRQVRVRQVKAERIQDLPLHLLTQDLKQLRDHLTQEAEVILLADRRLDQNQILQQEVIRHLGAAQDLLLEDRAVLLLAGRAHLQAVEDQVENFKVH